MAGARFILTCASVLQSHSRYGSGFRRDKLRNRLSGDGNRECPRKGHTSVVYLDGGTRKVTGLKFNKFLTGPDGLLHDRFGSGTKPDAEVFIRRIEALLRIGLKPVSCGVRSRRHGRHGAF